MRAWEVRNGQLLFHDVEPPRSRDGEMVVRVSHVGICGSDLPKLLNPQDFAVPEPWRPGHELVGFDPAGHVVAIDPLVPCGNCIICMAGNTHLCTRLRRVGWDLPGAYADEVVVPVQNAHRVPNGIDPYCATLADPAAVAVHGVRCSLASQTGHLAIVGAGTVGLITALYARQQGWKVTVIHRNDRGPNQSLLAVIPADFYSTETLPLSKRFDAVVDAATGANADPIELALKLVEDGGSVLVQNAYHPSVVLKTQLRTIFRRSIRLIGSFSYCRRAADDFAIALDLLRCNKTQLPYLVELAGELRDLPQVLERRSTGFRRRVLSVNAHG